MPLPSLMKVAHIATVWHFHNQMHLNAYILYLSIPVYCADYFPYKGIAYLVIVGRYSNWPIV